MTKHWLRLYGVMILLSVAAPVRAAQANQKPLVIRIIEKNWDDLPGKTEPYSKQKASADFLRAQETTRNKISQLRTQKGRPATYEGRYEDELSWEPKLNASEVLKKFRSSLPPESTVVVWYDIQFHGFNRFGEFPKVLSFSTLPNQIDPNAIFSYGRFGYRHAPLIKIQQPDERGVIRIEIGDKIFSSEAGSSQVLWEESRVLTEKELDQTTRSGKGGVGLESGRKQGGYEPGSRHQFKEKYTFRTQIVVENLGYIP